MFDFPPGGFKTFDEVCTDLLVLPALMLSLPVEQGVPTVRVALNDGCCGDVAAVCVCGLG